MLPLFNTKDRFGFLTIFIHWLMALALVGLFVLGLWMVELDYYHSWYVKAPDIHRSVGILVFFLLIIRLINRLLDPPPQPVPGTRPAERVAALLVHWLMYLLVLAVVITGYLISTADGRAVDVFGWFQVPATLTSIDDQEDRAGELHYLLAITLMAVATLHTMAALKHHFVNRDSTLRRMLGMNRNS